MASKMPNCLYGITSHIACLLQSTLLNEFDGGAPAV